MKSLSINVPLVKALEQMPGYAKFMKDLETKKRSINCETIRMTHQVSDIVHSMAPNLEDPCAFKIPCTIGSANFAKALCYLGASINLMPYSVFKTLGIGQPRPTSMRLQIANMTMKRPLRIIDDVLVRVDKFILPADFVILDCEVDYEVPIILGRPFLAIGKALVDMEARELTFREGDENVVFHICKSMRQPNSNEVCSFVDLVTEVIVDDMSAMINVEQPMEVVLLNHEDDEKVGLIKYANALQGMGSYTYGPRKLSLDLKNWKTPPTKPSIEEPPTLELKPLPSHLSKTMNDAQVNYKVTEKELLAIVFVMEKFRPYLMGTKVIVHTNHTTLHYLMSKKDSKARLMRWVLLLQEFDLEIIDLKGSENQVADHLSCLEEEGRPHDGLKINDSFPDEQLFSMSMTGIPWFADMDNFIVTGIVPNELSSNQRKELKQNCLDYYWDEPYLFKICNNGVIRRCVLEEEQLSILKACHSSPYGGHHGGARIATKILSCGFYCPTLYKDASELVRSCDECQRAGGISKNNEMPLTTILESDICNVWGINFMGPFVSSCENTYILVAVDYVSRWKMVRSRGGADKSKGRAESSRGRGKGKQALPLAAQRIISKKKPSLDLLPNHQTQVNISYPGRVLREGGSEASEPSSPPAATPASTAAPINVDGDDKVPNDGRGYDTNVSGLARSRKPEVWADRFMSEKAYLKFREWWPQRSLTLERQFIDRDLLPHNPNVKRQFEERKGWKYFTSKVLNANEYFVKEFYANVAHIKKGITVTKVRNLKIYGLMATP
ncbi:uncharacterized protein [Nicotiana tomentosiformis]|uniref:uncharacterized protein n=1 Tax=Nicotiana tomentosiformis TaxID=4098 RepID=UPI00388C6F60